MLSQVFLSYRHESREHAQAVRRLGELLRQATLPVCLDQFYLDDHPGGPDEGWPKWCEDSANESACVVILASEGWFAAYDKTAPPHVGLGAATEADLFRQTLWDKKGHNERLRLAFLREIPADNVPVRLRAWHHFRPFDADEQLKQLVSWIAGRLGLQNVHSPVLRWPALIPFEPDLADRVETEWLAIRQLLTGQSRERILLIEGKSGLGKSEMIRQTAVYAKLLCLPFARVDLKGGGMNLDAILGQLDLDLGEHLPQFRQQGGVNRQTLRKDLRALRQPVLVIFDSYEDAADNPSVVNWLNHHFLVEVETSLGLAVILAGKKTPDHHNPIWGDHSRHFLLHPIEAIEHWKPWVERNVPEFHAKGGHLPTIVRANEGHPGNVASSCRVFAKYLPPPTRI